MKSKFKALFRALPVMLLTALALTSTAAPVSAADGTWNAAVGGFPLDVVPVTGSGFTPNNPFTITFQGNQVATGTSSGTGTIAASFSVPLVPRGNYALNIVSAGDTAVPKNFLVVSKIFVTPTQGAVGNEMSVQGVGFTAFTAVTIHFDGLTNPVLSQATTNANGTFTTNVFATPSTTAGNHVVYAKETASGLFANTNFIVNAGIALSVAEGSVGDIVTVTGGGFTAGGSVQLYFDTVDAANLIKAVTANAASSTTPGSISTTITIPATARGNHTIIARDVTSTLVTPGKVFAVMPKIIISPATGAVGSQVTVTGAGFSANSSISFEWDGSAISGVAAVTSNATGGFTKTFTIPNATSGEHTITARDAIGAAEEVYSVAAKITLSPDSGTAGSTVNVQGNGFQTTGTVNVTYDNVVMATATLTNGTFSATFTVPGGMAGTHTVRATDSQNNTAVAAFTATLSATLDPITTAAAPGHVSQDLTITGTGFLPNSAITVKFGDNNIASATSNATGAFTTTFKAPAVAAGTYVITVTDGTNTRTFNFFMEAVAPAAPELVIFTEENKAKQPITFEWNDITDESGVIYTLQIAADSTFNTLVLQKEGLTASSYTMTEEEKLETVSKDTPYYWRVIATDGAGNVGAPSAANSFTVGFSFADVPVWAWVVGGIFLVIIIGGLAYVIYRRSASY